MAQRDWPSRPNLSVVVPAFNEAENIPLLIDALSRELSSYGTFEIIIVDDGSSDNSAEILQSAAQIHPWLKYLVFARNFGHQIALRAGLLAADGQCVISMDADLQHPPEFIHEMMAAWSNGAKIVLTRRLDEERLPFFKRAASSAFYKFLAVVSDVKVEPGIADFRLMDRKAVSALAAFGEADLFLRGMIPLLGFKTVTLGYPLKSRQHGSSKYSLRKMLRLAIAGVLNTSTRPLRIASALAFVVFLAALIYACYAVYVHFVLGISQPGWTSVIIVVSLLGAMQLFVLGIIGEYLAQTLREARRRPPYIVASTNICQKQSSSGNLS